MSEGWQIKTLGDCCVVDKRQGLYKQLPYVGLENIEANTGRFIGSVEPMEVKSSTFKFTHEHVLYGRLRPYLNKVMAPDFTGHCSTEIFTIKPKQGLLRLFLQYWFLNGETVAKIDATSTGTRMPRANMNAVLNFTFPLPPLPEQQRIVRILDQAFAALAAAKANADTNRRNARALFDSYLESVFAQRGEGWQETTIGNIAQVKGGKRVPNGYKMLTEPTPFPYLRVTDFTSDGSINMSDLRYISAEVQRGIKNYVINSNDLYLSIAGTIGKTGIIPKELDEANLTENACRLVFCPGISNRFIYYYTTTPGFAAQAGLLTRTTTQPKLALSRLSTIKFGIPPLPEQQRIVAHLDALREQTGRLESLYRQKGAALDELKRALLHQAFAGEL